MMNWSRYSLILCLLISLFQLGQDTFPLYQPAKISSELEDRDYAIYALWIEGLSKSNPGTHLFVLDRTNFIDPLKVPCEKMNLPDTDSSDAAIWVPLQVEMGKDGPIDPEKLGRNLGPETPYSALSAPNPDVRGNALVLPAPPSGAHGKVILFTRIAFRDERSEAGFLYAEWKDGDRIIHGKLVFCRKTEKSWRFVSPCDFVIKDAFALKAVTH